MDESIGSKNDASRTMYIACNHTLQRGYFLGDVISLIKVARCFVQNESHSQYILSLHDDPLAFLWNKFVRDNNVLVVRDNWHPGDKLKQYAAFDERHAAWEVRGYRFQTYKELYPRIDGSDRQGFLCGRELGLGRANIIEYHYYGQETSNQEPRGTRTVEAGIIDGPHWQPSPGRPRVYVSPWEKCQGNAHFTSGWWRDVICKLLQAGVAVTLNDNRRFMSDVEHELLTSCFPAFDKLTCMMSQYWLTLSGNSGIGWVAGACGYPLIVAESPHMNLREYSFEQCGMQALRGVVREPDVDDMVNQTLEVVSAMEAHFA